MATTILQSMGCEVSAINTVNFSNHTGYGQWKGTRTSASEITELYEGLEQSELDEFDVMLTGYIPGVEAVKAVCDIARAQKARGRDNGVFWVLDPVMGDNGRLYVAPEVVPEYRRMIRSADLIVPNQYEAEWLSGITITDIESLGRAINVLHEDFGVPHVIITSVSLPAAANERSEGEEEEQKYLSVIGSTATSSKSSRIFAVKVPCLNCFFSGTGDMFAALMVVRLREAVTKTPGLSETKSWLSPDDVAATDLPLANATELALASMQEVLTRTMVARDMELGQWEREVAENKVRGEEETEEMKKKVYLRKTRAAEVRLVRNLGCLGDPKVKLRVEKVEF